MALAFTDRWIWDFWLVRDGRDHHVFYLQAPSDLAHPDLRHANTSVGHAVSRNLCDWEVVADALHRGAPGSWDDGATWTGSVVADGRGWAMLYTGTTLAEGGLVQRIGLARSDDLLHWHKHHSPVLETDPRWYETLDLAAWHDQAWRDPWVFSGPDGRWHAFLTARAGTGDPAERGVVGHARSSDLSAWEVVAPLTAPGRGFGQMEVPQLFARDGRWYLVFCSDVETQAPARRAAGAGTGTYYLMADSPLGPFETVGSGVLAADRVGSTYAGKLHENTDGDLVFLAWHRTRPDGTFHGALSDPRPVSVRPDGSLQLG